MSLLVHIPIHLLTPYLQSFEIANAITHKTIDPYFQHVLHSLKQTQKAFQIWKMRNAYSVVERPYLSFIYDTFPNLVYKSDFSVGGTGYIDGILPTDVSNPVMQGVDFHGRCFFTVRYRCLETTYTFDGTTYELDTEKTFCLTLFQRFSDSKTTWCKAGHASMKAHAPLLYGYSTSISDSALKLLVSNIFRMLSEKTILYYDYVDKQEQTPSVKCYMKCELV